MILVINTADSEQVFIGLIEDGRWKAKKKFKAKAQQAEKLLPEIDKLIKKFKAKLSGIVVVSGPASFTALRIGVVTANTLAWGFKIPIVSFKLDEFNDLDDLAQKASSKLKRSRSEVVVKPFYGQGPNINKKK